MNCRHFVGAILSEAVHSEHHGPEMLHSQISVGFTEWTALPQHKEHKRSFIFLYFCKPLSCFLRSVWPKQINPTAFTTPHFQFPLFFFSHSSSTTRSWHYWEGSTALTQHTWFLYLSQFLLGSLCHPFAIHCFLLIINVWWGQLGSTPLHSQ